MPTLPVRPVRVAVIGEPEVVVAGISEMLGRFPQCARFVKDREDGLGRDPSDVLMCGDGWAHGRRPPFAKLLTRCHARRVVIYSPDTTAFVVELAIRAGADGYFDQRWDGDALVDALVRVNGGEHVRPAMSASEAIALARFGLTERETKILGLVGAGFTNTELAEHLFISVNTVKSYIRSSYSKLEISTRSQAVVWVYVHGLTSDDVPPQAQGHPQPE